MKSLVSVFVCVCVNVPRLSLSSSISYFPGYLQAPLRARSHDCFGIILICSQRNWQKSAILHMAILVMKQYLSFRLEKVITIKTTLFKNSVIVHCETNRVVLYKRNLFKTENLLRSGNLMTKCIEVLL